MSKRVVLAGGTGFIGQYFEKKYREEGYDIVIISRQEPHINWNDREGILEAVDGASLVINLAGKSVNCRYNERNKKEILNSRIDTTLIIGETIEKCEKPPALWINSSTATIYRHAEDRPMTEDHGEEGEGFSVNVGKRWEEVFFCFNLPSTRQAALRITIALGKDGGVIPVYQNLVKFGLGGKQGSGEQMFSWIHIEDLYRIVRFIEAREDLNGVFNCGSPNPVQNKELMRLLRQSMGRDFGMPATDWMLKAGAVVIRTEPELILKSRWVLPSRLLRAGFIFAYPTLKLALEEINSENMKNTNTA
ncbi:NAD-dependent epimerase [Bacillus sp. FJAT-27916]|uniref:TIGR01777 family oxidoreductase n=1 Tax=Bacillus sp. FJAT-27916 TaxID=1679169 RepID=UPI0006708E0E|nr:TIGR01777 family oxidoreductase [Bacillus sp. FJAT-27916]KMY45297.1 NAD-dependent epimerase [Bacillus sp. FJAT-27916]